jgi:hypothetical protein
VISNGDQKDERQFENFEGFVYHGKIPALKIQSSCTFSSSKLQQFRNSKNLKITAPRKNIISLLESIIITDAKPQRFYDNSLKVSHKYFDCTSVLTELRLLLRQKKGRQRDKEKRILMGALHFTL